MVWEVKTNQMPNAVQKLLLVMDKRASGMNDSLELLQCNENLPSSPGYNCCDEHMELDDLPELQAVQSDPTQSAIYQLSSDVSHQEYPRSSWNQNTSDISENTYPESEVDWLTELANIATSPQSPLMQCSFYNRPSPVHIIATSKSLHSYARPPPVSSSSKSEPAFPHHRWKEETPVRHERGYGSDGLKLLSHEESVSFGESVLKLTFDPGTVEDGLLTVECKLDHPFYVKNKGWSSFYPSLTVVQHGIPCCEVHTGDVCLPPGHPDAINFDDSGVFDTFKSYDFTPMDSSAVYVLSSMARQRRASLSCGGPSGQDFAGSGFSKNCGSAGSSQLSSSSLYAKAVKNHSSGTVSASSPNKCKRPMNAFMLFAKKYRVEYTQMYPGKDNRAISVILGDRWKKMKNEERRMYTLEAKALAEEQKRLNPDCWKRKRTNSVCFTK
ncbi:HMG box-containing protein 1 [Heterocephalus glaber]|uniref:HMG box-containing protein 1 n=1 Tax=Heterocephalus glaber TaxID=10181 RepID=G5C2D3_HETGA|nr:HMG box-containing protein 1 [Heterocephalus glaber]